MGKDGIADAERKAMMRSIVLCTAIAIAAVTVALYLRLASAWVTSFEAQPVSMILSVVLLALFYSAILVSVANLREMKRTVSGWFDVLSLMVITGILAYMIFESLLYVSLVLLLCSVFVLYVHLAQRT